MGVARPKPPATSMSWPVVAALSSPRKHTAAGLRHLARGRLTAEEHAAHVRIHPGEEVLGGGAQQVLVLGGVRAAEVVHEPVDASLGSHHRVDHRLVAVGFGRVVVHGNKTVISKPKGAHATRFAPAAAGSQLPNRGATMVAAHSASEAAIAPSTRRRCRS